MLSRKSIAGLAAALALLPVVPGALAGGALYFRDLGGQFLPARVFALEGLRSGEIRSWNPYLHEGEPVTLPALGYPPDLLQLAWPDERGVSLSLALHLPAAALALFALARGLGLQPLGAGAAAAAYALGGFALSSLNLYVYVQALAWAPLVILGLLRAARGARRELVLGALAVATALSTTAVELVAQALAVGGLLGVVADGRDRRREALLRMGAGAALGLGLASYVVLPLTAIVAGSARGQGFPTEIVLAHSVHPITFLQALIAGLHGDPANITGRWWGTNFFPRGFPYVLSLYLGPTLVALALAGLAAGRGMSERDRRLPLALAILALAAGVVCLGRYAGLGPIVDLLAPLRSLRYPTKAYFTIHLAAALLGGLGLDALVRSREGCLRLARLAGALSVPLLLLPLAPLLLPAGTRWFLAGFCPPGFGWPARESVFRAVAWDAAAGGFLCLLAAALGLLAARGALARNLAAGLLALLVAADLLRAGAGLNPWTSRDLLRPSAESLAAVAELRPARIFSCDVLASAAYRNERLARGSAHEKLTFAALADTLTPDTNVAVGVRSGLGLDRTMLVPVERVSEPEQADCHDLAALLPRMRAAGVSHVVSLEPLVSGELALAAAVAPARIRPLVVRFYALRDARPLVELRAVGTAEPAAGVARVLAERPGQYRIAVSAAEAASLVVREAWAEGWRAEVDGRDVGLVRADGRHLGLGVPAGASVVTLRYEAPRLRSGVALSLASGLACALLALGARAPKAAPGAA
ncbi:MAG: hypothetical protein AB7O37_22335 [Vicinamibacteria bacterium]